jgi:hypothetical protein
MLEANYTISNIQIPPMYPSEEEYEQVAKTGAAVQSAMLASLLIPFLFFLFARFSMSKVWSLFYML